MTQRLQGATVAPDDVHGEARARFDEAELVRLTMAVVTINGFNRLAIAFRADVGGYQPRRKEAAS